MSAALLRGRAAVVLGSASGALAVLAVLAIGTTVLQPPTPAMPSTPPAAPTGTAPAPTEQRVAWAAPLTTPRSPGAAR